MHWEVLVPHPSTQAAQGAVWVYSQEHTLQAAEQQRQRLKSQKRKCWVVEVRSTRRLVPEVG